MSLINAIGRIIHEEQSANRNPADKLSRELNGIRIFEGRVKDVERRTEGGFARGKCSIEGLGKIRATSYDFIFRMSFFWQKRQGENRGQ